MPLTLDAVIFGGGAAGLWLLDELTRAGFSTLLLEAHELGSGQTIASQGIIHGGLKYTLGGLLTPSARAISQMPTIWRRCLAGEAKPDLSNTRLRAEFCHLWRTTSLRSRLAMIGARAGLRVAPVSLAAHERPAALADSPGIVARLDEQVIEPGSFIGDLAAHHRRSILKIDAAHGLEFQMGSAGSVDLIRLLNPDTGEPLDLKSAILVMTAGAGNESLRRQIGLSANAMQRRPLHMVMARGKLPALNGHCVDGASTRVTVTTTRDSAGRTLWQVGGQVAERGVAMNAQELMGHAHKELLAVLPGVDFADVEWATYQVDRAEAATRKGGRPEDASVVREGNTITAWPTKLALVPALASRIMELIGPTKSAAAEIPNIATWPQPVVALPPWETAAQWFTGL